jgi:NADPH:quinone reductase-like Zn-dependent oxidoreductase
MDACRLCHTDAATVTGAYRGLTLPRVPGHEVVGRVDAIGPEVDKWAVGQRGRCTKRLISDAMKLLASDEALRTSLTISVRPSMTAMKSSRSWLPL